VTYRFLHIADVHLGRHAHTSPERYADYFDALASVVTYARNEKVDALLVAGDLFDEQEPSAGTLRRAMETLRPLRDAAIDVIAIEGNHDRRKRGESAGALDLLESEGYLKLLRPVLEEGKLSLPDWNINGGGAVYHPIAGVCLAGLGFIPHTIEAYYAQAASLLPEDDVVILLAHVMTVRGGDALEYGCIAFEDLAPLAARVSYLALGHRHTRRGMDGETDGWVFNPGSLEYVNSLDYQQPADLRGFYDVTVTSLPPEEREEEHGRTSIATLSADENKPRAEHTPAIMMPAVEYTIVDGVLCARRGRSDLMVRHVATDKRPAHTLRVDITDCAQPDDVRAAVWRIASTEIDEKLRARCPILIVRLQGVPAMSRVRLPRAAITEMLREEFGALHVEVFDRDVLGSAGPSTLQVDEGGLEQVADRARAIAAELLAAQGIAHGREADLSATLLDLKLQLQGTAKQPSDTVLERMRDVLQHFVEYDEQGTERRERPDDSASPDDSAFPDDTPTPAGGKEEA
jgi:DNA repair exonuclease SbcCD nuclease subunit